jgi:hypothetical protein
MINHGRTLLLNRSGATRPDPTYFLEEYVPEDFRPVPLPSELSRVYEELIGADSDDAYANYIVHIILRAIHSTEQSSALADLDPRITYLHDRDVPPFGFEVRSTDQPDVPIHPSVEFYETATRRKLYHRWLMNLPIASLASITSLTGDGITQEPISGGSGLTDPILLSEPDTLSVRFGAYLLTAGSNWDLEGVLSTDMDLTRILTILEDLGGPIEREILGSAEEPYPTFKKLWENHILIQYRIAGYMLGYVYKVEEARLQNG